MRSMAASSVRRVGIDGLGVGSGSGKTTTRRRFFGGAHQPPQQHSEAQNRCIPWLTDADPKYSRHLIDRTIVWPKPKP